MLWLARLLALSMLLAAATGATRDGANRFWLGGRLEYYEERLVRGMQDETVEKDVLSRLGALSPYQVGTLHAVCCSEDDGCMSGLVAFLVREHERFACEDVGTLALYLKYYFLEHIKELGGVPLDRSHPEHLEETAVLRGLALWYENVGYVVTSGESLKEALSYVFFADERPETEKVRAGILLELVNRRESKTLSRYWEKQSAARQLEVYRNALADKKHGLLPILQPIIFYMDCTVEGGYAEEDYIAAFRDYAKSVVFPDTALQFFPEHLQSSLFPKVAEALSAMTGRAVMRGLEKNRQNVSPTLAKNLEPFKELALGVVARECNANTQAGYPDYAILDAGETDTWKIFDAQLRMHLGPSYIEFVEDYRFFPHERMAKYIVRQYGTLREYVRMYEAAVQEIRKRIFQDDAKDVLLRKSDPAYGLDLDTLWQAIDFLEDNPVHGGPLRWIILRNGERPGTTLDGMAPDGVGMLVKNIIEYPNSEARRATLCKLATKIIEKLVGSKHPLFEGEFELIREQIQSDPFGLFNGRSPTRESLDMHILGLSAVTGVSDDLHGLQVAIVVGRARDHYKLRMSATDLRVMEGVIRRGSTEQLGNIYKSNYRAYPLFRLFQWLEPDTDFFEFDRPVDDGQIFALLSRIYRHTYPDRKSVFGLLLDSLSRGLVSECPFPKIREVIPTMIPIFLHDRNVPGDLDEFWREFERVVYGKCDAKERAGLVSSFGPELAAGTLATQDETGVSRYGAFEELLDGMRRLQNLATAPRTAQSRALAC